jgi:hypothetical protein
LRWIIAGARVVENHPSQLGKLHGPDELEVGNNAAQKVSKGVSAKVQAG